MKNIFGSNPITSIAGYLLAGLYAAQELLKSGEHNYWNIGIAVGIAVLGRVAGDSNNTK